VPRLHDTIEDTETTPDELEQELGQAIKSILMDINDDKTLPKAERKRQQIEHATHASNKAKLVKLTNKISNLRDVANKSPPSLSLKRRQEYFDWAKDVID